MSAPARTRGRFRPSPFSLIMLSTAASGVAALLYQIAWVRVLVPIIGIDFFAVSAVATGTLLGLAIGSFAFGLLSDRVRNKLVIYLLLEILIPLTSLGLLAAVRVTTPEINELLWMSEDGIATMLLQFLFGGVVVMIPSLFMGGTLPALIGLFYEGKQGGGNDISLIYAVNTAGSALSALVVSWLLVGWIGVTGTFVVGGVLNLASAALVAALYFTGYSPSARPEATPGTAEPATSLSNAIRVRLLICYLIAGFVGLGFQQVVYRLATFVWGPATAQYSFVVGMFLVGLVAGAILVNRAATTSRHFGPNLASITWLSTASAVTIVASIFVTAAAHHFVEPITTLLQRIAAGGIVSALPLLATQLPGFAVAGGLAISLPMAFSGAIYPIVNHLLAQSSARVGLWTGLTLLSGIFGSLLGSLATTYGLLPWLGFPATVAVLAALSLLGGQLASAGEPSWHRSGRSRLSWLAAAGLAVLSAFLPNGKAIGLLTGEEVVAVKSGITGFSHLALTSDRARTNVYVNGKVQGIVGFAGTSLPRVLLAKTARPDARRILLIGIGDGQVLYFVSSLFPDAEITAVELSREIAPLLAADDRYAWMRQGIDERRFRLVNEDGRFFLKQNPTQYDLIITMALRSGDDYSSFLYSREFLELIDARLTGNGYFFGMFSPYARIMVDMVGSTFTGTFAHVARGEQALIMGTNAADAVGLIGPLPSSSLAQQVCGQPLPQGLAPSSLDDCSKEISSLKWLDGSAQQAPPILDDRPRNEFYFMQ